MANRPAPRKRPVGQPQHTKRRALWLAIAFLIAGALLIGRLFWVQVVWGPQLREQAQAQRARVYTDPARRGEIVDREGNQLAYTMQARSLTVSPVLLRSELRQQEELKMRVDGASREDIEAQIDNRVDDVLQEMADGIPTMIAAAKDARGGQEDREAGSEQAAKGA